MPDDLSGLEEEFKKRLEESMGIAPRSGSVGRFLETAVMNEHGQYVRDPNYRNPFRTDPTQRENQRKWIPTRDKLWVAAGFMEMLALLAVPLALWLTGIAVVDVIGKHVWIALMNGVVALLVVGFLQRITVHMGKLHEHINGMDRLYGLPIRCDACDREFIHLSTNRCGTCEVCPGCQAPIDPRSEAEQCFGCKMDRAG